MQLTNISLSRLKLNKATWKNSGKMLGQQSKKLIVDTTSKGGELTWAISKHNILVKVFNAHNTVYSDQMGRLPVQFSRGNQLLIINYDVDRNYITAEPMKEDLGQFNYPSLSKLMDSNNTKH